MMLSEVMKVGKELGIDEEYVVYTLGDLEFVFKRPSKPGRNLKREYDPKKNLQIWIREGKEEFMPNHLRILLDLEFKIMMRPQYQKELLLAFDRLFYGDDPDTIYEDFKHLEYPPELRSLKYDLYLAQLFFVEQEIGYHFEAKFIPKYLYLQGWIRCLLTRSMEIDRLLWSATRNPPPVKFTKKDNKKHKEYDPHAKPLWYLKENDNK
ncbi:MAG: hypothetical protein J7J42_02380 [Thermoplasmata archaeon]|nr:hypothetical protein [Thermoplasmata archaeon]